MTRAYAMIANGGKLVEPHLVKAVEEPRNEGEPAIVLRPFTPPRRPRASTPTTSASSRRPLRRHARELRDVAVGLRRVPDPDRGQDGHGREVRRASRLPGPARPVLVVRLRPVWEAGDRRLRPDRKRRPRRRRQRPVALKVFEDYFNVEPGLLGHDPGVRLMATPVNRIRSPPARQAAAWEIGAFLRHVDYLLLFAPAGSSPTGSGCSSRSRATTSPGSRLLRLPPTDLRRRRRPSARVHDGREPRRLPSAADPALRRLARPAPLRVRPGQEVRGSKRWIEIGFFNFQPSELGKLALIFALAGFVAERRHRMSSGGRRSGSWPSRSR